MWPTGKLPHDLISSILLLEQSQLKKLHMIEIALLIEIAPFHFLHFALFYIRFYIWRFFTSFYNFFIQHYICKKFFTNHKFSLRDSLKRPAYPLILNGQRKSTKCDNFLSMLLKLFYFSRYHFSQLFRTSFNTGLLLKKIPHMWLPHAKTTFYCCGVRF